MLTPHLPWRSIARHRLTCLEVVEGEDVDGDGAGKQTKSSRTQTQESVETAPWSDSLVLVIKRSWT